ncbi:hypothetical protein [Mycobacterium phage WXIN]|nr:hypothetical protein [Mycobacterium phage WXIN]
MNQTIEDLKAARDIVKDHWHQGALEDGNGNYCVVGAINKATCGHGYFCATRPGIAARRWSALDALNNHLPWEFQDVGIPSFNDNESTTHADVLTLFDKALADLGGLA